jgi:hypothetical protein
MLHQPFQTCAEPRIMCQRATATILHPLVWGSASGTIPVPWQLPSLTASSAGHGSPTGGQQQGTLLMKPSGTVSEIVPVPPWQVALEVWASAARALRRAGCAGFHILLEYERR